MRDINLGAVIARERRAADVTQGELAAHLGVTKAAVSKWELGQSMPDVALLPRIAAYFDLTLDELFDYRPQLTKDEVLRVSAELYAQFAEQPDLARTRVDDLVAEYYSCWRLLQQIGVICVQRAAFDPERAQALSARAAELFERVEAHADDVELVCGARMMRSAVLNMQGDADGAIELMKSLKPDMPMGVDIMLAGLYQQRGDIDEALKLYQESVGFGMANIMTGISSQLLLYFDDAAHREALLQAGEGMLGGFCLEESGPVMALTFFSSAATSCLLAGDEECAAAYLERFVSLLDTADSDALLFGMGRSVLYDLVPEMSGATPEQARMASDRRQADDVKRQCKQAITACPEWMEHADDPRFRPLLDRLEALR